MKTSATKDHQDLLKHILVNIFRKWNSGKETGLQLFVLILPGGHEMIAHSQEFYFHSILLQETALPHMSPPKNFAAEPPAFRCLVQSLSFCAGHLFDRTLDGADATNRQRPTVDDAPGR